MSSNVQKSAPASSYLSLLYRILSPFQLITSTVKSIVNFFAPNRLKSLFREVHWLTFLDNLLHFSRKNPIFTQFVTFFVRPVLYFFWGDAIQKYLRDFARWIFSPPRIVYYLELVQATYWPEGKFVVYPIPSPEEAAKIESECKHEILRIVKAKYPGNVDKYQINVAQFFKNFKIYLERLESLISRKDLEDAVSELLALLHHKTLNKVLLYHALDLLLKNILPELCDDSFVSKFVKHSVDTTENLPSPSSNRARSRFYRNKGLPVSRTCHRHPNVSLLVEEDFISCQKCHEIYCRLLCTGNFICRLHNAQADSCQCYRGPFICKDCIGKMNK